MSIRVKSFLKDVGGAGRVTEARREKLKNASAVPDPKDPIRDLADKLHPSEMQLRVTDIRDASPTAKTFRFEAVDGHIPVFQCGQFVNLYDLLRAVRSARRAPVFRDHRAPQRTVPRAGLLL